MQEFIKNLKKRRFEVYQVEKKEDVYDLVKAMIQQDDTISFGGSKTLVETGLIDKFIESGYNVLDRREKSAEEAEKIMRESFFADHYFCSVNAISQEGILVNIDGTGNRVAAMAFGPKNVFVLVGKNKITEDVDMARTRASHVAAPLNARRLDRDTPCSGANMCFDCRADERICASFLETKYSKPAGRIKIILIDENLGF